MIQKLKRTLSNVRLTVPDRSAGDRAILDESDTHKLFLKAPEAIAVLDRAGRILHCNDEFLKMFGYSLEEALGRPIDELIVRREDLSTATALTEDAIQGSKVKHDTVRYTKNGDPVDVSVLAVPITLTDGQKGIHVIYRDIGATKKEQDRLRGSEERLRILFENAPDAYYLHDMTGTFLDGNKAAEILTGYERDELIGQNFMKLNLLSAGQIPLAAMELAKNAMGLAAGPVEFNLRRKDGLIVYVEIRSYPVQIDGKSVVLGIARDITSRRNSENDLRENEEKFRAIFENSADGVAIMNDRCFLDCNGRLEELFGCSKAEILNKTPADFSPPCQHDGVPSGRKAAEEIKKALAGSRRFFIWTHQRKDGTVFESEVSLSRFSMKGRTYLQVTVHDITVRRTLEKKLLQLSTAVEQSSSSVVITDLQGRIEYVNSHFEQVTGYSSKEVLGNRPSVLKSGEMSSDAYKQLWETITSGKSWRGRFHNRKKNGELFWEDASIAPLRDSSGSLTGYVAVKIDITKQIEAENELIKTKEAAVAATNAKSQFLAMMSHEIRTPMNGVIGMAGLLAETDLTPEQSEYVETIRLSGDSLLTIINDILDFSKAEAGKIELENQSFQLQEMLDSVIELVSPRIAQKGIDFICHIDQDLPRFIYGDATRLRQVILNLVGNAIKFTDRGEVAVEVHKLSGDDQQFTIQVDVIDTGIGIPDEKMDRLFRAFSQVDASTTRRFGGTGLGLVISAKLVERMGGTISVKSTAGQGSKFSFTMPTRVGVEEKSTLSIETPDLSHKHVLIVDDNPTNRRILSLQLKSWGMVPESLESGTLAVDMLKSNRHVDLLIVDMQMPGMDGATLARLIRGMRHRSQIPMILLTSMGQPEDPLEIALFDACVNKPIKQSVLYDTIVSTLSGRAARSAVVTTKLLQSDLSDQLPIRILVAEDNGINQKMAVHAFGKMGYQVDVVSNGLEAVTAVERIPYDVVFMDLQMPEMDGLEATREIRNAGLGKAPIIIAMTANAMEEDRRQCLEAGMNDYVTKPVKPLLLQTKIIEWFSHKKQIEFEPA